MNDVAMASVATDAEAEVAANRCLFVVVGAVNGVGGEEITFMLDELEATEHSVGEIVDIFTTQQERTPVVHWIRVVEEYWRLGHFSTAIDVAHRALEYYSRSRYSEDKQHQIPLYCMLATYHIALARDAPKTIIQKARADVLARPTSSDHPESRMMQSLNAPRAKQYYWDLAKGFLKSASMLDFKNKLVLDGNASLALASGRLEEASRLYEAILKDEPTNLFALMGRGRSMIARRQYRPALKAYQTVLAYSPKFLPDPRIAIGLCFYMLKEHDTARKAWQRSIAVHPNASSTSATLLLGLTSLNSAKGSHVGRTEEQTAAAYTSGIQSVQAAFKANPKSSAAAGALASHLLAGRNFAGAIKYSERMIQYADLKSTTADGYVLLGRALQGQGDATAAFDEYGNATSLNPDHLLALLGRAQNLCASTYEHAQAIDTLERALRTDSQCLEALVILASIHTYVTFTLQSATESLVERKKAKSIYDQALRLLSPTSSSGKEGKESNGRSIVLSPSAAAISNDPHIYIELARLWSDDADLDRSLRSYKEAARIYSDELESAVPPQLINDIGVLELHRGHKIEAINAFEQALTDAARLSAERGGLSNELDATLTAITFNLGVAYEAMEELDRAKTTYNGLLERHPEFVDAKARLALMAMKVRDYELAHSLTKEALTSQHTNPDLRALYTHFLIETNSIKAAREFTVATIKDHSRHDVHALCASGMLTYLLARENKDPSKEAQKDRPLRFLRAAEFYDKALLLDPYCAFAAQGLAISIAEGTLGVGVAVDDVSGLPMSESAQRARNSRDALSILMKVKDSLVDGSVYVNIGHCHFAREEWEKAIENYQTASQRFYNDRHVPTLLYLARSWYRKANKDHSYSDLRCALAAVKAARELQPNDLAIIFNIAIVQQKGVEIVFDLPAHKRTLDDINLALADGEESQVLLNELAQNEATVTPYPRDIPYQRRRFGQTTLKRGPDILAAQTEYESLEREKLERARLIRETEKRRIAEQLAIEVEQERVRAKSLADQRQLMREEAEQWSKQHNDFSDEEEDKKKHSSKGKKRKTKKVDGSADGSGNDEEGNEGKPKRKKTKGVKKAAKGSDKMDVDGSDEDEPVQSGRRKPAPKKAKNGKDFKSTEFIGSDEENTGGESEASSASPAADSPAAELSDVVERDTEQENSPAPEEME